MERYELETGTFEIVRVEGKYRRFLVRDEDGQTVCEGSYAECRRYISERRKR